MEPKSPSKLKLSIIGLNIQKGSGRVFEGCYFTVVGDCGSTGTRVNVYEWALRGKSKRALPVLSHSYPDNSTETSFSKSSCKYHCLQTEPGLDKFVGNLSGVRDSLDPLIAWAERVVPLERHGGTLLFVLATAGLRRLVKEDRTRVLEDVEAVVKEHSFLYQRSWIRVLSGKEEAYYGWVALNYKMGMSRKRSMSPMLGLLDLGGSSLQVVIEVDDVKDDTHLIRSKFGFIEHRILAYSLPAFGLNEAFNRTVVLLSHTEVLGESGGHKLEIRHPCFGPDFVQNYTCYGCFGRNFSRAHDLDSPSFLLVGVPNWEQCKILARNAAMNSSKLDWAESPPESNRGSGLLNLTTFSRPATRFHALSGFFAVYDILNLSPRAILTRIWEEGRRLCSRTWTDKSSVMKNQINTAHYCFRVPYIASLIESTLYLGDREILFGPADVSWTLGAALVEGEYLWLAPSTSRINALPLNVKLISSPIFVFFMLVCLLAIVYCCQVKLPMLGKKSASP